MLRRTIPVMVLWTAVFSTATTPGVAMAAAIIGTAAAETPGGINVGNLPGAITAAQGISIAGVRAQAAEKYSIGNPPAMISANELQTMKSVMDLTITAFGKPLTPAGLAATQKTYATAALRLFTNEMPADFKLQNKKINDLATDMLAVGDVKAAAANAFATQTARGNKPSTKGTDASALANGANTAGAYALNIDPYAVQWDSVSNRSITLDLTGIVLKALTSGDGSTAVATMNISGSFINGTDDTNQPIDSSSPLFTLSFGATDFDDTGAQGVADLSFLGLSAEACALLPPTDPCQLGIRDTVTDPVTGMTKTGVGLPQVLTDLTQAFGPLGGGNVGVTGGFSISMDVPGDSPTSLIFLNEIDTGVAQVVSAPASLVFLLGGLPVLLFIRRRVA